MAMDICFDLKTFLERTCRCCSRYFGDDEMQFNRIFADVGVTRETGPMGEEEQKDEKFSLLEEPSEGVKEIYEELCIWKLNIKPVDGLPQQMCMDCMERFRGVKLFREECLDTQKVLESYFRDFDSLLESASLGRISPKTESIKCEPGASPSSSFNPEDLVEEVPESPERPQQGSPYDGSPKFRFSPKFNDGMYAESSMGTPPPLFEEIKTEPIDSITMEYMKPEMPADAQPKTEVQNEIEELLFKPLAKKSPPPLHFSSSDDESSTPTSDEEDTDTESESTYRLSTNAHNPLQCTICYTVFPKRSLLKEHHLRVHPQEKPYSCNVCTSTFKSKFLLAQHKLKHNRPDSTKCELCSKYFRSQLHLQRHAKNFHLTSTYTCHICHEKFENYTQIRFQYHVRQHGEKRFHCEFCDKSFHQKVHLLNHERTHTKEQPFRCEICGKTYRQQTACQEHMLTHKDPTPFKCKICQKGFTQRSSLRLHYRTHTGNKPFHCDFCGQNFAQKAHYEMHMLTHNAGGAGHQQQQRSYKKTSLKTQSLKTFKCQYCDKSFQNKQVQSMHEQQHQQDALFKCSFCSETFLYRSAFGQHMISHLEGEHDGDYDHHLMDYSFNAAI